MNKNQRLQTEKNIWMATVRPNGWPHLVPVWFTWHDERIYLCIQPNSVKARNLADNPNIALSLEDGEDVVVCEGSAETIPAPYPNVVVELFQQKYDWDITNDQDYTLLLVVTPRKWLGWKVVKRNGNHELIK